MEFSILKQKYELLKEENQTLKSENRRLKTQLGLIEPEKENLCTAPFGEITPHTTNQISTVNKNSSTNIKVKLFSSIFKGRTDVYARKWVSKKGTKGYLVMLL